MDEHFMNKTVRYHYKRLMATFVPDKLINTYHFARYHRRLPTRSNPGMSDYIHYLKSTPEITKYAPYADKISAKERAAALIGFKHIVPNFWVGKEMTPETWETLPSSFMIKASHGSGWNYFVSEKSEKEFDRVRTLASSWMKKRLYYMQRELIYLNIEPRLLAEMYIGTSGELATDYKFYCVAGEMVFVMVILDRGRDQKDILYDRNWNKLRVRALHPNDASPDMPDAFPEMVRIAETLANGFDFVRIDLYLSHGHIYFGEYTFCPGAGYIRFCPDSYDREFGSVLTSRLGDPLGRLENLPDPFAAGCAVSKDVNFCLLVDGLERSGMSFGQVGASEEGTLMRKLKETVRSPLHCDVLADSIGSPRTTCKLSGEG